MVNELVSLSCSTVLVKAKNRYNLVDFCLKMYPTDLQCVVNKRFRKITCIHV